MNAGEKSHAFPVPSRWPSTSVLALACLAPACSSTQTSLNAPTDDKCQVSVEQRAVRVHRHGRLGLVDDHDVARLHLVDQHRGQLGLDHRRPWRPGRGVGAVLGRAEPGVPTSARSATVVVGSQSVTLSQAAAPVSVRVEPGGDAIGYGGGRLSVDLTTLTGCAWTASSGDGWIAVTSRVKAATPAGPWSLAVSANTRPGPCRTRERSAARHYTVTQDGAPAPPPAAESARSDASPTPRRRPRRRQRRRQRRHRHRYRRRRRPPPPPPPPPARIVDFDGHVFEPVRQLSERAGSRSADCCGRRGRFNRLQEVQLRRSSKRPDRRQAKASFSRTASSKPRKSKRTRKMMT